MSTVAKAIGMSRTTIHAGLSELKAASTVVANKTQGRPRVRAAGGGGRKKLADKDDSLLSALDALVDPTSRGDPMSPLRWTCKSFYRLSDELKQQDMMSVSERSVTC